MLAQSPPPSKNEPRTPTTVTRPAFPIPALDNFTTAKEPAQPTTDKHPVAVGLEPEATRGTRFEWCEQLTVSNIGRINTEIGLMEGLRRRKVYSYIFPTPSNAADYSAKCEIEFWRDYTKIGGLFVSTALSSVAGTIQESVPSIFVGGGVVVADTIALYLAQPTGGQPNYVLLQPHYVWIAADRVTVNVLTWLNMTSIRLWVGVISSEP